MKNRFTDHRVLRNTGIKRTNWFIYTEKKVTDFDVEHL